MRRIAAIAILMALALVASSCRRGDDESSTTTTAPAATTSLVVTTTTPGDSTVPGGDDGSTTTTAEVVGGTPTYQVVERSDGEHGDELVVLVEPGSYTEVELQNLVYDIVDRFQPVRAIVVDDAAAVVLAGAEELSEEDAEFLAGHTFFVLTDGVDVTFSGPYSQIADLTVGS
jgi:hypothetical protein